MNNVQKVDLLQPIMHTRLGAPPIALRIGTTPSNMSLQEGPQQGTVKVETYVLLSALPTDLQERVKLAIQVLIAGR